MSRRHDQKEGKTMMTKQNKIAALTDPKGAQTMATHRERNRPTGMVPSTLRGLALAGVAMLLVGCDSGGANVLSPTPLTTPQSSPSTGTSSTPASTPTKIPAATAPPTGIIGLSGNLAFGTDTVGSSDTKTMTSSNPTPHPSPVVTRRRLDRPGRAGFDYPASLPRSTARGRATKKPVAVVNPDSM